MMEMNGIRLIMKIEKSNVELINADVKNKNITFGKDEVEKFAVCIVRIDDEISPASKFIKFA